MSLVRGQHSRRKAGEHGHYCQASGCKNGQSNPKQPSTKVQNLEKSSSYPLWRDRRVTCFTQSLARRTTDATRYREPLNSIPANQHSPLRTPHLFDPYLECCIKQCGVAVHLRFNSMSKKLLMLELPWKKWSSWPKYHNNTAEFQQQSLKENIQSCSQATSAWFKGTPPSKSIVHSASASACIPFGNFCSGFIKSMRNLDIIYVLFRSMLVSGRAT